MKILWVKAGGLLPLDQGGKIRSYNIVRQLAKTHSVIVFTFYPAHEHDENPALGEVVDRAICHPLFLPDARSLREMLRYGLRFCSPEPFALIKYCRKEVSTAVRELVKREDFDAIICDFLLAGGVIPWTLPTPKILFTHNVEALIWERHFRLATNPIWKAVCWREWRTTEAAERRYLQLADYVLAVSDYDRHIFSHTIPANRITTIPTGVDTEFFQPRARRERPNSLVFTGSMDWMPNEDGIIFFLEEVYPLVQARVPDVSLKIVGRRPSSKLRHIVDRQQSVTLTGWVNDVRPHLDEAQVCVVPLRVGSGTRLKIFEAMAMGKAIVSTSLGAEGLPVTDGRDIILADHPDEFASNISLLLKDPARRMLLGSTARKLVTLEYGWSSVARHFVRTIELLIRSGRDAPVLNEPDPETRVAI